MDQLSKSLEILTLKEVEEAFKALTPADWARLELFSRRFAHVLNKHPKDVVSSAVIDALDGTRKCRRNLKPVAFLFGIIRSEASNELKKKDPLRNATIINIEDSETDDYSNFDIPAPEEINPENQLIAKQEIDALFDLVSDDEIAGLVMQTICEGMSGTEACKELGISKTDYESARRKINRRLDKSRIQP